MPDLLPSIPASIAAAAPHREWIGLVANNAQQVTGRPWSDCHSAAVSAHGDKPETLGAWGEATVRLLGGVGGG